LTPEQNCSAALSDAERVFVEHLLKVAPEFRYEPSGRREIRRPPAPGLESAVAVAKMMSGSAKAGDLNRDPSRFSRRRSQE